MPKPGFAGPVALSGAGSIKNDLRKLHEGARAMRQAHAARRQSVLFVRTHLAEGAIKTVGKKHRIVPEATRAARRPDQRAIDAAFDAFLKAVRPHNGKRRDEGA